MYWSELVANFRSSRPVEYVRSHPRGLLVLLLLIVLVAIQGAGVAADGTDTSDATPSADGHPLDAVFGDCGFLDQLMDAILPGGDDCPSTNEDDFEPGP